MNFIRSFTLTLLASTVLTLPALANPGKMPVVVPPPPRMVPPPAQIVLPPSLVVTPIIVLPPTISESNPGGGPIVDNRPAPTDNIVGPIIQSVIPALVPQNAYVPGPAAYQTSPSGPTFTSSGAGQVLTAVVAASLVNNINYYLPADYALNRDEVANLSIGVNGAVAGGLALAAGATASAALPAALIATAAAAAGTKSGQWIENNVTDDAMGGPKAGVATRAVLNGASAGAIAGTAAVAAAYVMAAPLTVPATVIAGTVGTVTAVAYVARPQIDAAVDGFFDGVLRMGDAVAGPPPGYQ